MEFPCGHCGHTIPARDEFVGEQVVCIGCGRMAKIPEPPPMPLTDPAVARGVVGLLCPRCHYKLQGLPDNRCPECGRRFDPLYLIATRWGQTPRLDSGQVIAVAFVIAVLFFLVCSGIRRDSAGTGPRCGSCTDATARRDVDFGLAGAGSRPDPYKPGDCNPPAWCVAGAAGLVYGGL